MGLSGKRLRSILCWVGIATVVGIVGLYAAIVRSMIDDSPIFLLSCMEADNARWSQYTCEQVLRHASLTQDHVHQLNQVGGALFPMLMEDPKQAEEMLVLFLSRGVDINARNPETKGWTALHVLSMGDPSEKVAILLKHGARVDLRDADGRTALDLALRAQQKKPENPQIAETIRLLEAAQRKLQQGSGPPRTFPLQLSKMRMSRSWPSQHLNSDDSDLDQFKRQFL